MKYALIGLVVMTTSSSASIVEASPVKMKGSSGTLFSVTSNGTSISIITNTNHTYSSAGIKISN